MKNTGKDNDLDYGLDFKNVDFRQHPELYRVGKGEQGVLLVEPYKSEILPYWRFKTPQIARKSVSKIYKMFLDYKAKDDFVGMDMARKFLQMADSFSLLTLNCFGLWLPNTWQRLTTLAKELEESTYQVVCLQEIQLHKYQRLFVERCPSYPYAQSEPYVHCPKGGLLTLSRIPIRSKSFMPYEERGLWYTPMLLDRLFYKGMSITRLTWNDIPIVIINTHLIANLAGDWERGGMYARVEEKQLRQLAETVRSQPADSLVIVVGDFNIPRGGNLYHDFLRQSGLTDLLAGDTRPTLRLPLRAPSRFSLAIDYALIQIPEGQVLKVECDLCFSGKYQLNNHREGYLSDHYGVELGIATN